MYQDFLLSLQNFSGHMIHALNSYPPEFLWGIQLLFCYASILILYRLFGKAGLYISIVLAIIGANIQVMKLVQFSILPEPLPLGTILFISTYLCTDILSEHYGPKEARRAVLVGFVSQLLFVMLMFITLGFKPLTAIDAGVNYQWAVGKHEDIFAIFGQQATLYIAGFSAYLISQYHDVWMYNFLKWVTKGEYLWIRNNVSTIVSTFIDNAIFSILAWKILSPNPVEWDVLMSSYIFGVFYIRVVIALLDTPFLYLAGYFKPKAEIV